MGKTYDQLDIDERYEVYRLHEAGKSPAEIGRLMGRHRSLAAQTVSSPLNTRSAAARRSSP